MDRGAAATSAAPATTAAVRAVSVTERALPFHSMCSCAAYCPLLLTAEVRLRAGWPSVWPFRAFIHTTTCCGQGASAAPHCHKVHIIHTTPHPHYTTAAVRTDTLRHTRGEIGAIPTLTSALSVRWHSSHDGGSLTTVPALRATRAEACTTAAGRALTASRRSRSGRGCLGSLVVR